MKLFGGLQPPQNRARYAHANTPPSPPLGAQEQEFLQKQQQDLDTALKKIIQQHKHELATIERDCLNHKQQLLRGTQAGGSPRLLA